MNRPSIRTYLLGNPLSVCAAIGTTGFLAYRCYAGAINPVLPCLMVVVSLSSLRAAGRIVSFHRWQREWTAMHGVGQQPRPRRMPAGLRPVLGLVIWAAVAVYVVGHRDDDGMRLPALLFWMVTALMAVALLVRALRRLPRRRADQTAIVRVCVARAMGSPSAAHAFAALPPYCAALLAPTGQPRNERHA